MPHRLLQHEGDVWAAVLDRPAALFMHAGFAEDEAVVADAATALWEMRRRDSWHSGRNEKVAVDGEGRGLLADAQLVRGPLYISEMLDGPERSV